MEPEMRTVRPILTFLLSLTISTFSLTAEAQEGSRLEIPKVIVIKNVHVWDGTSDTLKLDHDVLIVGDKIRKVAKGIPTGGNYEVDAVRKKVTQVVDAPGLEGGRLNLAIKDDKGQTEKVSVKIEVIDGKSGYLIPGLIDSHQHIMLSKGTDPKGIINNQLPYTPAYNAIPQGKTMLMMGITTIRDTGGPSVELGRAIDAGYVDGPRIYSCGAMVTCTSGHGDFGGHAPGQGKIDTGSSAQWASNVGFATIADGPAQ